MPLERFGTAGGSGPSRLSFNPTQSPHIEMDAPCAKQAVSIVHNVTMTFITPPKLVLRFGLMEGGWVVISNNNDGGGGRTR